MAIDAGAIWGLADVLRKRIGSEEASKRTAATVVRTDKDGTVWVRCAGSDTDTPVNGTCPVVVSAGDVVEVEISDGRLSVLGNSTDPAAGIESAKGAVMPVVEQAVERARQAVAASTEDIATAKRAAGEAKEVASATSQHFWTDDDGVHITEVERDEWLDESSDSHHAGSNALFTTVGQLFRDGLNNLVSITRSAVAFFDGTGNDEGNISALFGYSSARVGKLNSVHTTMSNDGFSIVNGEGTPAIEVSGVTEEVEVRWQYSYTYTAPDPYPAANGFLTENVAILVTGFYRYDLQQGQWVYDTPEEVDENALVAQLVRDGNVVEPSPTGNMEVRSDTASGYVLYVTINRYYSDDGTQLMEAGGEYTLRVGVPKTNWSTTPYVRIGTDAQSHAIIDYHSLQMVDKEGDTYLHVSDLRGVDGKATIEESFDCDGSTSDFALSFLPNGGYIKVTDNHGSGFGFNVNGRTVSVNPTPYAGDKLLVTYKTTEESVKAYTFGSRAEDSRVGGMSAAFGAYVEASGAHSFAVGTDVHATGHDSHAEGRDTHAEGVASHAEGLSTLATGRWSHAEGVHSVAQGDAAHAEGCATSALAYGTHAQNWGTIASGYCQTAMGKFNKRDDESLYALIIGNGNTESYRSNALAVDWFGIPYHRNKAGDWGSVFDLIYPVGSIYMSVNATSPAALFGGTWERIQGRFLLAATDGGSSGASQEAGGTGGSATVTLTAAQSGLPAHTHAFTNPKIPNHVHSNTHNHTYEYNGDASAELSGSNPSGRGPVVRRKNPSEKTGLSTADYTGNTGNPTTLPATTGGAVGAVTGGAMAASSAHENMPPWLAVYVWKRTA